MRRAKADWSSKWLTKQKLLAALKSRQHRLLKGKPVVAVDAVAAAALAVMGDAVAVMATVVAGMTNAALLAAKTAAKS
jgi:hypothetical protein